MWRGTKRRQCNGSRRRQSTASVIVKLVSQKLSVGFLASRHVNRSPVPRSSSQFKIREGSPLLSSLEQPPSERNFFRGKLPDFNQKRSFSARQKIGKSRDFDPPRVFNSGSGATPGWENASRGQVSRFSGAMTRSKTQRALKPLVTYVHARCGRY